MDEIVARLAGFSPSSLDVEVLCWFATDYAEYRELRQEVVLGMMRIVEQAQASFAPTQKVHFTGVPGPPPTAQAGGPPGDQRKE